MMYGRGKSSPVIVAGKPASVTAAESVERRAGPRGMRTSLHAPDSVPGLAWSWRWLAYVKPQCLIVSTRGELHGASIIKDLRCKKATSRDIVREV